jgi:tetratricopeptide (TPR) repeat protein
VARGTQHRKRRTPANARVGQSGTASVKAKPKSDYPRWEDQLFFNRLRHHAKWVFLAMAIAFAFTFAFLGVGSGSTGIGDSLQNFFQGLGGSGGGSNVSKLVEKTAQNPKDAASWRALATAYEQKSQDDNAIQALSTYTTLHPKDTAALTELAGLYLTRAQAWETVYQAQQAQLAALIPSSPFQPKSTSPLGKAIATVTNPVDSAVQSTSGTAAQNAYSQVLTLLSERLDTYKKLAKAEPKDANAEYQLGQAAQDAGDSATAIAAYTAFLKLAPSDPLAPTAKKALKQLKGTSAAGK